MGEEKKNSAVILFRSWIDACRDLESDDFKSTILTICDYILDKKEIPKGISPLSVSISTILISDFDQYKRRKDENTKKVTNWREKKTKEEKEKDKKIAQMEEQLHRLSELHNGYVTVTNNYEKLHNDNLKAIPQPQPQHQPTPQIPPLSSPISPPISDNFNSSLSPCVCVTKDACAPARENTHTQEEALPEGLVLTKEQIEEIKRRWPSDWQARLSKFASRLSAGYVVSDQYSTLIKWAEEDDERMRRRNAGKVSASGRSGGGHPGSFDTDDFVKAAMNRNFDDM